MLIFASKKLYIITLANAYMTYKINSYWFWSYKFQHERLYTNRNIGSQINK